MSELKNDLQDMVSQARAEQDFIFDFGQRGFEYRTGSCLTDNIHVVALSIKFFYETAKILNQVSNFER